MASSRLHTENRPTGILNELIQDLLVVVVFLALKTGERTHTNDVTIATHYRDSLQKVLWLITIHNDTPLCLQLPSALVHIKHNGIHTQVHRRLLRRESSTQTGVKEDH